MTYNRNVLAMDHILEMIAKFASTGYSDFSFTNVAPKANVSVFSFFFCDRFRATYIKSRTSKSYPFDPCLCWAGCWPFSPL